MIQLHEWANVFTLQMQGDRQKLLVSLALIVDLETHEQPHTHTIDEVHGMLACHRATSHKSFVSRENEAEVG